MSEQESQGMPLTQADVHRIINESVGGRVDELKAAVEAKNSAAAPPDEFGQFMEHVRGFMTEVRQRLGQVEQVASAVAPLVEAGASRIPGGAIVSTVLDRISGIEQFANDLFGALDKHWAGKLAIPTPPPVG